MPSTTTSPTSWPCSTGWRCERAAVVGISATAMTALRLAAEQPAARVAPDHHRRLCRACCSTTQRWRRRLRGRMQRCAATGRPTSTSSSARVLHRAAFDQALRGRCAAQRLGHRRRDRSRWACDGWLGNDVREQATRVRCPTLVIHGDDDQRVPYANGRGDRPAGAGRAAADHRRWRPPAAGARPGGLLPRRARLRRPRPGPLDLGARDGAQAPGPVHLQRHRPGPCAARPGDRARDAQAAARAGDRLVHRRPGRHLPGARRRTAAPDHAAPGQREPALRGAWPASTTCRPSSRCARWTS